MRRWQPIALFAVAVLGLVAASGFVVPVRGQAKKDIAEGSYLSFEKEFSQVRGGRFFNMRMGKEKPDAKVIDVAARFYIKRFLAPDIYDAQLVAAIKDVNDEVNQCLQPGNLAVNKDFLTVFSAALVKQSREITSLPLVENAKNVLHLTQTFPTLGRLKQDSIAAYFLELVNADDAKHPGIDAIRIYAFRGLREFLPVSQWGEPMGSFDFSSKSAMERKNLDLGRIDALTKFIHRKPRVKAEDEEMGAYLYLRREAIETLAQAAAPAVNAHKKTPQVEGPIATTLLKALVPGAMTPPSTLAERNEAALGLCHVRGVDEYAAAPTIHYVAKTLLELGQSYNRDRANPKAPAEFPWKITAKRWEIALGNLSDTAKGPASRDPSALKLATDLKSMGIRDVTDRISKNVESGVETNKALAPFVLKSRPREETLKLFRTVAGPEIRQPALDE